MNRLWIFLLVPTAVFGQFTNPLEIPPTLSGQQFELTIAESTKQFYDGRATETIGFNGDILGPTLIFEKGEAIDIMVRNQLDEPTTVHWHGMHVSPEDDGGPHTVIEAGMVWNPDFTVLDRATTFWYHPHLHERTNYHVTKGATGMIIVRSAEERTLDLPRTYGEDDFPLIIQGKSFDNRNQLDERGDDNVFMVNGTLEPYLEVPAQMVRLRLLNGSNSRVLLLGFSDNRTFQQIGSDGGLLSRPVDMQRVRLSSGERAEIVVDLSSDNGSSIELFTYASELGRGISGGMGGGADNGGLDGQDVAFLELRVGEPNANAVTSISTSLATHTPWSEEDADNTRTITFDGGGQGDPFNLDGDIFDDNVFNHEVILDDIEVWTITNNTNIAHPFHIHDVQFYILDRNGAAPPENEQGLKDVVLVEEGETVRFITKFEDFADPEVPYMYHCHILPHEDGGMMGQFIVIEERALDIRRLRETYRVYPNPVTDNILRVLLPQSLSPEAEVDFSLFNLTGQEVGIFQSSFCGPDNLKILYLEDYKPGIYHLLIKVNGAVTARKKVVMD